MENLLVDFNNVVFKLLVLAVLLDTFLGSMRAIKSKKWNSNFGINGMLRKISIIGSSIFLIIIDSVLQIDLLFFIPKDILSIFKLKEIGIFDLFGIMFILYEATSIMKNMVLCGMPVPKKAEAVVKKLLNEMTDEMSSKGGENNE